MSSDESSPVESAKESRIVPTPSSSRVAYPLTVDESALFERMDQRLRSICAQIDRFDSRERVDRLRMRVALFRLLELRALPHANVVAQALYLSQAGTLDCPAVETDANVRRVVLPHIFRSKVRKPAADGGPGESYRPCCRMKTFKVSSRQPGWNLVQRSKLSCVFVLKDRAMEILKCISTMCANNQWDLESFLWPVDMLVPFVDPSAMGGGMPEDGFIPPSIPTTILPYSTKMLPDASLYIPTLPKASAASLNSMSTPQMGSNALLAIKSSSAPSHHNFYGSDASLNSSVMNPASVSANANANAIVTATSPSINMNALNSMSGGQFLMPTNSPPLSGNSSLSSAQTNSSNFNGSYTYPPHPGAEMWSSDVGYSYPSASPTHFGYIMPSQFSQQTHPSQPHPLSQQHGQHNQQHQHQHQQKQQQHQLQHSPSQTQHTQHSSPQQQPSHSLKQQPQHLQQQSYQQHLQQQQLLVQPRELQQQFQKRGREQDLYANPTMPPAKYSPLTMPGSSMPVKQDMGPSPTSSMGMARMMPHQNASHGPSMQHFVNQVYSESMINMPAYSMGSSQRYGTKPYGQAQQPIAPTYLPPYYANSGQSSNGSTGGPVFSSVKREGLQSNSSMPMY